MKRTILTTAVLAAALLSAAGSRAPVTRAGLNSIRPQVNLTATISQPQENRPGELTEEFHQIYPLSATGRVSVENINGPVHITVWDQTGVKVDAVKRAYKRERLDEATIDVVSAADSVRIRTKYPEGNQNFSSRDPQRWENPAYIEYSLTIPRKARVDSADLVNGALDIEGVEGDVKAACVNGRLRASGLGGGGDVKLSTVNGAVEVSVNQLEDSKIVSLNSVNGRIILTIPAGANANVKANTVHGGITNDFGLQVNDGEYVGHDLSGQIGNGGPRIRLSNVNGAISIKRG